MCDCHIWSSRRSLYKGWLCAGWAHFHSFFVLQPVFKDKSAGEAQKESLLLSDELWDAPLLQPNQSFEMIFLFSILSNWNSPHVARVCEVRLLHGSQSWAAAGTQHRGSIWQKPADAFWHTHLLLIAAISGMCSLVLKLREWETRRIPPSCLLVNVHLFMFSCFLSAPLLHPSSYWEVCQDPHNPPGINVHRQWSINGWIHSCYPQRLWTSITNPVI